MAAADMPSTLQCKWKQHWPNAVGQHAGPAVPAAAAAAAATVNHGSCLLPKHLLALLKLQLAGHHQLRLLLLPVALSDTGSIPRRLQQARVTQLYRHNQLHTSAAAAMALQPFLCRRQSAAWQAALQ
jgi:hypothetical protein